MLQRFYLFIIILIFYLVHYPINYTVKDEILSYFLNVLDSFICQNLQYCQSVNNIYNIKTDNRHAK